jgi:Ribbon-helix-helix protein, copG family
VGQVTYPLGLSKDLLDEVKRAAKETGLSTADVMRQAIKFGVPKVRRRMSAEEDFAEAAADTWEKLGPPPTINYDKLEKR